MITPEVVDLPDVGLEHLCVGLSTLWFEDPRLLISLIIFEAKAALERPSYRLVL